MSAINLAAMKFWLTHGNNLTAPDKNQFVPTNRSKETAKDKPICLRNMNGLIDTKDMHTARTGIISTFEVCAVILRDRTSRKIQLKA